MYLIIGSAHQVHHCQTVYRKAIGKRKTGLAHGNTSSGLEKTGWIAKRSEIGVVVGNLQKMSIQVMGKVLRSTQSKTQGCRKECDITGKQTKQQRRRPKH